MTSRRPLLALDAWTPEFQSGRAFNPAAVRDMRPEMVWMAAPWLRVGEAARAAGFEPLTADQVEAQGIDPREVLLISHDWTPIGARLLARGARPAALLTLEPPVIAWSFYYHLRAISARFPHTFVFRGARERVAPSSVFHDLRFPVMPPQSLPARVPWQERRLMVMVNSGKVLVRNARFTFERPREYSFRRELAALLYPPIGRDRYLERLRAIRYFAPFGDFDLYGAGWDKRHRAMRPADYQAAVQVYRGPLGDKLPVLARYRFLLCMENTRFPGYLSEKMFDCFYAGCIPVYDGAPDVANDVPPDVFVDARQFRSYAELRQFLVSMDERRAERYLEAAQAFLASPRLEPFSVETFVGGLVEAAKSVI